MNPMRSRPLAPSEIRRAVSGALSASTSSRRASMRNASPAGESATRRRSRSSSRAPTARSSFWICRLSGGWVMDRRSAARPKCSSSATATKQRS